MEIRKGCVEFEYKELSCVEGGFINAKRKQHSTVLPDVKEKGKFKSRWHVCPSPAPVQGFLFNYERV